MMEELIIKISEQMIGTSITFVGLLFTSLSISAAFFNEDTAKKFDGTKN